MIGTGGWNYFRVPGLNPLNAYSKIFNFVEVNSTFYEIPPLGQAKKWRSIVPPDFMFSVRAHRSLTHRYKLKPMEETFETFDRMKQVCTELRADVLHLQVPLSFQLTDKSVLDLGNLVSSLSLQNLRLALEIRRATPSQLPPRLSKTLSENNMIHCVDLSKGERPVSESNIVYTRLFGKGETNVYQPTDDELMEIDKTAMNLKPEKVMMSFHFVKMYKDAARLKIYKQSGKFPKVTRSKGLASLEEVLAEDVRFPSTKQELIYRQGWKIVDVNEKEQIRAMDLLQQLPDGTYSSFNEIAEKLGTAIR